VEEYNLYFGGCLFALQTLTMEASSTLLVVVLVMVATSQPATEAKKLNVLFLVSDDMRPEIGAYSGGDSPSPVHPKMHTPSLDALAADSLLLKQAYVQQAVCSPSRTSLLTGRRPDTTHVHDLLLYFRDVAGNFTTIPQYFKENGYATLGMGKIFHPGRASNDDDPMSWTGKYFHADNSHWVEESHFTWTAAPKDKTDKYPLPDQLIANHAIDTLRNVSHKALSGEQPFFVAVGFHRPHLPWVVPAEFLQYYPEVDIELPSNPHAPQGMPEMAWSNFDEIRTYRDIQEQYGYGGINTTLPDAVVRDLRRAYYAAISYTDSLIGQVIQTLDELGLANNTIVSFWGDHGWQVGEHGEWCKHTNFEIATHAPMMVRVPGLTDGGKTTEQMTEFVDLFPTLAEAAGLPPIPLCPENSSAVATCSEGVSLVPLMSNPGRPWKEAVFSQYPRMDVAGTTYMGYSMRTERYRYTEWVKYNTVTYSPVWTLGWRQGPELYDHQSDPEENVNVGNDPAYHKTRATLSQMLHAGWRAVLPSV
jgi:iduronate 2-sulfatase